MMRQATTSETRTERIRGRDLQRLRSYWFHAKPLCVICERANRVRLATELDHILPLHKGGTNDDANLQGLCTGCHADKTRKDLGWKDKPTIGIDGWPVEREKQKRKA